MVGGGAALPRGVVTFLLTDIEGSTELWQRDPSSMTVALERHDAIVAAAVTARGGFLLKAKGEGDSTFSVFERPTEAVAAALHARADLASEPWPETCPIEVRFAVHMGEASIRDGDYYGTTVNRAARIRGVAVGGQILVSDTVASVVVDALPEGVSLVALGEVELRGLARPERIWALTVGAGLVREQLGGACPYRGLLAFEPEDEALFFGREEVIDRLIDRLVEHRFLVVVGASGSGKSSLIRAGVIASLRAGRRVDSGAWAVHLCTPGASPLEALAAAGVLEPADGAPRVLVVDQFEELFTMCADVAERAAFVDALLDRCVAPASGLLVLCAVRADFYAPCTAIPRLADALSAATEVLVAMDDADLRRAIDGPAQLAELRLDPGLCDLILRDLGHEPGSLPLLSHALLETWRRRRGRTLTVAGYQAAGGVHGAIAHTAESVWAALDDEERRVARSVFLRLADPGEGTEDTRRRATLSELGANVDTVTAGVVATLVDARLLIVDGDGVEVAHEALIREWPRLRTWLDDDRELLRVQRHLGRAAQDWLALDRDPGELYRGPRLAAARALLDERDRVQLDAIEAEFLQASVTAEDDERRAAEDRVAAQARSNRRLRVLLVAAVVALVGAAAAGVVAYGARNRADHQAQLAREATVSAEVDRIVAAHPRLLSQNRDLASLLAVEANALRPGPTTQGLLLASLLDEPRLQFTLHGGANNTVLAIAVPGRPVVVTAGRDEVDVWDLQARRLARRIPVPGVSAIAASAAGDQLAVGATDGSITFLDAAGERQTLEPLHLGAPISGLSFAPDGRALAVALGTPGASEPVTEVNSPRIIDLQSAAAIASLSGLPSTVSTLAYTRDGRFVITAANDGTVTVHDAATGSAVRRLGSVIGGAVTIAVDDDGGLVAVGTASNGVQDDAAVLFDVAGARAPVAIRGLQGRTSVSFASNGNLVAGDGSGSLRSWAAGGFTPVGSPIETEHGAATTVGAIDGVGLISAGTDGTVSVWQADAPAASRAVPGALEGGGVFSPDGSLLATVGYDDSVRVLRTSDFNALATLSVGERHARPGNAGPTGVAFSPDGGVLAVDSADGSVQLFDTHTFDRIGTPIHLSATYLDPAMAFSPDGRMLVATSVGDGNTGAWVVDIQTRQAQPLDPPAPFAVQASFSPSGDRLAVVPVGQGLIIYPVRDGHVGIGQHIDGLRQDIAQAVFSPDGSMLAAGTIDGAVVLADSGTYTPIAPPITVSSSIIAAVVFSPDGRLLMTQDQNQALQLIDVQARSPIGAKITGSGIGYGWADFSPDGRSLVLPHPGGAILLTLDVEEWKTIACTRAGRSLTPEEWSAYLSAAGPYAETCPNRLPPAPPDSTATSPTTGDR